DMRKYIIGTISSLDQPLGPSALGDRSFYAYQSGMLIEALKKEREQILNTSQEDIRRLAPYVRSIIDDQAICTIGGDSKIAESGDVFDNIRSLS
ncbi:MAG: hypothetical protein IKX76_06760, partial [Eubacterium sp.]|nr:hypothetical protein [Eubacterium sp.]